MDNRGISIAEGDVLVLCIRLFSELLQGRYSLPQPKQRDTLLARHSAQIFASCTAMLASFPNGHKDERFNGLVLPQSEPAVAALGHAMAYSYAIQEGVPPPLLDLFECAIINMDPGWYAEQMGITGDIRRAWEDRAVRAALPNLREYIDGLAVRPWITAPIVSDATWDTWLSSLVAHRRSQSHNDQTTQVLT